MRHTLRILQLAVLMCSVSSSESFNSTAHVAIYVVADLAFQAKHELAIATKRCYAQLHGYSFVLEHIDRQTGRYGCTIAAVSLVC